MHLGAGGNARRVASHKRLVSTTAGLGTKTGRTTSQVIAHANEVQAVGITFPSTDAASGSQSQALQFSMPANPTFTLPEAEDLLSTNTLIAGDTVVGSDSCLEIKSVYQQVANPALSTTRELHVFDSCLNEEFSIATIDDPTFMSSYVTNNDTFQQTIEVSAMKNGTTWTVGIYNITTGNFDYGFYDATTVASVISGQSGVTIDTFGAGACPNLGIPMFAQSFQTSADPNDAFPVYSDVIGTAFAPTSIPAASPPVTPECFQTAASTTPHYSFVWTPASGSPGDDTGDSQWALTTNAGNPAPHPTPPIPSAAVATVGSGLNVLNFAVFSGGSPFLSQITGTNPDGTYTIEQDILNPSSGATTSYESLSSVSNIDDAVGPDGDVWSVVQYGSGSTEVRRYSTSTLDSNFTLGGRFGHIVPGPDSRGWFVAVGQGVNSNPTPSAPCVVSATTASGTIADYTPPSCTHYDITNAGGQLWITAQNTGSPTQSTNIYQVDTSGNFTLVSNVAFFGESLHSFPSGSSVGPLYLTETSKLGLELSSLVDPTTGSPISDYPVSKTSSYVWTAASDNGVYYLATPVTGNTAFCRFKSDVPKEQCWGFGSRFAQPGPFALLPGSTMLQPGSTGSLWLNMTSSMKKFTLSGFGTF